MKKGSAIKVIYGVKIYMRKKVIRTFLLCIIVITFNTGCVNDNVTKQKELNVMEGLSEEEIIVFSPNAHFKIYDEISKQRQFYVDVVTTKNIDKEKLSVKVDAGVSYKYSIEQIENEVMDFNVYLKYIGKSEEVERLKKDDYSNYEYKLQKYEEEFKKRKIKKILHYRVYVTITQIYDDTKIDLIDVKYNNKTYSINVGNIEIYSDSELVNGEKGINMMTIASSEVKVQKNNDGIENYTDPQVFKTKERITIKDIRLLNTRHKIDKCSFTIENSDYSVEQEWNGEKMDIQKGSTVGVNLNITNSEIKKHYEFQGNEYVIIEYEYKNKNYCTYWEVNFDSLLTGYELCVYLGANL